MVDSRQKGIRGELECCKLWEPYFPEVRRSFGQSRQGYEMPDLVGGGIEKCFYIEVKRTKEPPTEGQIQKWVDKHVDDWQKFMELSGLKPKPLLMFRSNHQPEWVVLFFNGRIPWRVFREVLDKRFTSKASPPK